MTTLPVLNDIDPQSLLLRGARSVTRGEFLAQACALAAADDWPKQRFVINLCQDRHYFMLTLAAACLRGATNLLPASQAAGALQVVAAEYPNHHVVDDDFIARRLASLHADTWQSNSVPRISADHIAAICFTSGSTGTPQAHRNSWGTLMASAGRSAAGIFTQRDLNLVATVPPQHMFGLETSIFQPWVNDCAIDSGKPFFPADVAAALRSAPEPRALISTPTHLRACLTAGTAMPPIEFVLSATAPMPRELAAQLEAAWRTRVLEIYGSTETGAMATRRTTDGDAWTILPGGSMTYSNDIATFRGSLDAEPVGLQDRLERLDERRFILIGRSHDLIKVAGKRASLAELNARLLAIPGVRDGVIFQPEVDKRVAALVVADGIDERHIAAALSAHLDEVFLPRPLRLVTALPRDSLGKLPRAQLLAALDSAHD